MSPGVPPKMALARYELRVSTRLDLVYEVFCYVTTEETSLEFYH